MPRRRRKTDTSGDPREEWHGHEARALRTLLPYLWPADEPDIRARVVAAVVLLVGAKVATVLIPAAFGRALDALDVPGGALVGVPLVLILGYGALRVASMAFGELRDYLFAKVGQRAIRTVALQVFRHLHALSLAFHLERRTGGLARAIERGIKGIDFLLRFMLFNILPTLVEIGLVCAILWAAFGWEFAAVVAVTLGTYIAFTLLVTEWRLKYRRAMNESDSQASTHAIDSLLNFETVKYFGNEEHEARRYDVSLRRYETAAVRSLTTLSLLNIGQAFVIAAGLVTMLVLAGNGVVSGAMTVGDFSAANLYLMQLAVPLNFLGFVYREIKQSLVDMEQMFALLKVERQIADAPDAVPLAPGGGTVRFEDVHFGYDPRRPILKGVTFEVPAGRTLAIVGATGAGKSTIPRLLFRFWDVASGRVTIDGQDVRAVTQDSLRAAIGIVPQDTVLFNDSIRYNIRYGRPDATDEEVYAAAKLAQVHDFVTSLPDGYDTRVGERGLKLSGGEKQRVAIARTIVKGPRILVFDEATSALDTHTEKEIQAALARVSADRTTLVIAHRLSTVVDADEIIVIDDGRIVERGRHHALLAQGGRYAHLWTRQQEAAARDGADAPATAEPVAAQ
ncbi:MAG: ABC transporter ATP-binding protein/permease [Alphaproteobacteria bacterium]